MRDKEGRKLRLRVVGRFFSTRNVIEMYECVP